MSLPEIWFVVVAVLFAGYFLLEGFDFGVGMLMPFVGRRRGETSEEGDVRRRVLINTIGPVWDGNEVWVITGAGAMFAAFPGWYATMFSALYLPLLLILVGLIARVVAIEWRGKIDDPRWRRWCDVGIGLGSWLPAFLWGVAFANLMRGLPIDSGHQFVGGVGDLVHPYALLGGAATTILFLTHGAVFLSLKTADEMRVASMTVARRLAVPAAVVVLAFGLWNQAEHGTDVTAIALAVAAVAAVLTAVATTARREASAFAATSLTIAAVAVIVFGTLWQALIPSTIDPAFDLAIAGAASSHYTLTVISWASIVMVPVVVGYQAWTYWVFRQRISTRDIPSSIGLSMRAPTDTVAEDRSR
ncbi:cytochrome d ubiquinol oxidase subunit II [Williamsia phyllosphaerae]|uniref:Cytochrome D ubiquinol oxidase subunit II n=1 Tax=Williamsia phyllosphaerae TaxID=885042 RepID=A0ABQ1V4F3_9NOCA|nr:cytochrome d ubiquinol oxidase subunit II [Williamsia phyllosphaerae]GGF37982.1 cytochrome D ubiquinol oxidase subunit II [Williamsia phyllosphaerae]